MKKILVVLTLVLLGVGSLFANIASAEVVKGSQLFQQSARQVHNKYFGKTIDLNLKSSAVVSDIRQTNRRIFVANYGPGKVVSVVDLGLNKQWSKLDDGSYLLKNVVLVHIVGLKKGTYIDFTFAPADDAVSVHNMMSSDCIGCRMSQAFCFH